jgi:hypothetical protein
MSHETDALVALRNAWNGAMAAADRLRESQNLLALPPTAAIQDVDLEACATLAHANANAAQALRGLVETLKQRTLAAS